MIESLRRFEIPGHVTFDRGEGGLPRAKIVTPFSQAEIYLHGAQVTAFQKDGEHPLLFLSPQSQFAPGKAIRGGVPICFPWFGSRPGQMAHGYARVSDWELTATTALPDGPIILQFRLPERAATPEWAPLHATFIVTVADDLTLELVVANESARLAVAFEACLHSYFAVGDVAALRIGGLESALYLDKLAHNSIRTESSDPMQLTGQTDRAYLDSKSPIEIRDPILGRTIRITKTGSSSTVVWNPWTTQPLADLSVEEYRHFICVESGNVERNQVRLEPGQSTSLSVHFQTERLKGEAQGAKR